jgi:hypothetical protein
MKAFVRVLFILIFFSGACGFAQEIEWQKTIGGSKMDVCEQIQEAHDGGFYCGGYSESGITGNKTVDTKGHFDFWVVKLDSLGGILWQKDYGGIANERCNSIYSTTDGGLICGGYTNSSLTGDLNEAPLGVEDFLVFKLDSLGNLEWQNRIGGSMNDLMNSIIQTSDGGYMCGGHSKSSISGDKITQNYGEYDYWIVKLDSIGNVEWEKSYGGSNREELNEIIQTNDGGFLCGGVSHSEVSGNKTQGLVGQMDYWIIKLDSIGNIEWQRSIGGGGYNYCYSVLEALDGGFICAGYISAGASGDVIEQVVGGADVWIVKLSSTGTILWQKLLGGDQNDLLLSACKSKNEGVICAARSSSSISGEKSENSFQSDDYWIFELDSVGNILWQNTINGTGIEHSVTVQATSDGNLICNGTSTSGVGEDKTEPCFGNYDNWIVKLSREFNLIQGNVFLDFNSNNILDSNDHFVNNKKLMEIQTGRIAYTNSNGQYAIAVLDTGLYQTFPPNLVYFTAIPSSAFSYFVNVLEIDSLNDFAMQPSGPIDDLCLSITPLGLFRRGRDASYQLSYDNAGTTTQSPKIVFRIFPNTNFVSSSLTPSAVYPDSVVWNLPPLSPLQSGHFFVTIHLTPSLPIGSILNSYAQIFPVVNDVNPSCNNATWEVTVRGSYDPNDILVDQDTLYSFVFPNPPFLDYIIRFQNVGNDTAFAVKILNPIDTMKLDLNSLEFVAASHPMEMRFIYHERNMEFLFNNILLPDSNVNEPASHGFVRYKIKPKSNLQIGDSIQNFAAIYFDFNEPVITNTAKTHILLFTGLAEQINTSELFVYPNPSSQEINIQVSNTQGKRIVRRSSTQQCEPIFAVPMK